MPLSLFFITRIHNVFKNQVIATFLDVGFSIAANSAGVNFKLNTPPFIGKYRSRGTI